MRTPRHFQHQIPPLAVIALAVLAGAPAMAADATQWKQDDNTLAWMAPNAKPDDAAIWRFSFDPSKGKTFFQPLSVNGGPELTNYKPQDHPWHYGLWFSWKYINHVNYWEEDATSGVAAGKTTWKPPTLTKNADGSARIALEVSYTNAGVDDMTEHREINVSPVAADGSYAIDWRAHFTAGKNGADLDRTPMPGEPNGVVNGGYAGMGLRMAGNPLLMSVTSTIGPISKYDSSRARPKAAAIACNFTRDKKPVGSIALFSDPVNTDQFGNGKEATWYIINDNTQNNGAGFRFACPSILAPKVVHLDAGKTIELHYLFAVASMPFTQEALQTQQEAWLKK